MNTRKLFYSDPFGAVHHVCSVDVGVGVGSGMSYRLRQSIEALKRRKIPKTMSHIYVSPFEQDLAVIGVESQHFDSPFCHISTYGSGYRIVRGSDKYQICVTSFMNDPLKLEGSARNLG